MIEDVQGITIITSTEDANKVERTYGMEEVFEDGVLKHSMTTTLMQCMQSVRSIGMSFEVKPVMDISNAYEVVWKAMNYDMQRAICALIVMRQKVAAIKILRKETGWDLKPAKAMIDSLFMAEKVDNLRHRGNPDCPAL